MTINADGTSKDLIHEDQKYQDYMNANYTSDSSNANMISFYNSGTGLANKISSMS